MNIIFKYYFKENHQVLKCCVKYLELISVLGFANKKNKFGIPYKEGITPQLQEIQQLLLNTKELNIFKCNVYIDNQIIL